MAAVRSPVLGRPATGMMCAVRRLSVALAGLVSLAAVAVGGGCAAAAAGGTAPAVRTVVGPGVLDEPGRDRARCGREPLRRRHRPLPRPRRAVPERHPRRTAPPGRARRDARRRQLHRARVASGTRAAWPSTGTGDIFIAEATAQRVQEVRAGSRTAVTVAGTGAAGFNGDGLAATPSELDQPTGRGGGRGR